MYSIKVEVISSQLARCLHHKTTNLRSNLQKWSSIDLEVLFVKCLTYYYNSVGLLSICMEASRSPCSISCDIVSGERSVHLFEIVSLLSSVRSILNFSFTSNLPINKSKHVLGLPSLNLLLVLLSFNNILRAASFFTSSCPLAPTASLASSLN